MPYHSFKENLHPLYTVAFAETVGWNQDDANDTSTTLALITNNNQFPPLQPSRKTTSNTDEKLSQQWQVVQQHDTDSIDGLTVISNDDNDNKSVNSHDKKSITADWQRVEYQRSFAEIASLAIEKHILIPNERFFKQERRHLQKKQSPAVANNKKYKEIKDDISTIDPIDDFYYVAKGSRKVTVLKDHYANKRKRNKNQYRLHRYIHTLPQTLTQYVEHEQKIKQKVNEVQKIKDMAENDLWPQWRRWSNRKQWKQRSVSYIKGGEYFSKKVLKDKDFFGRMPKAEFLRTQLLDGIIQHCHLSYFPVSKTSPLPSGKRITGAKHQRRHIIATATREEEEKVIDSYVFSLTPSSGFSTHRIHRHSFGHQWQFYDNLLLILRKEMDNKYTKQLEVLDQDYRDSINFKGMLKLLYKHFPRHCYMSDNRKLRRQHIQSIIAHYKQFAAENNNDADYDK